MELTRPITVRLRNGRIVPNSKGIVTLLAAPNGSGCRWLIGSIIAVKSFMISPEEGTAACSPTKEDRKRPMRSQSAMNLPPVEPWPHPVDGRTLLDALMRLLMRFVILPKWAAQTLALWIVHTYAFALRDVSAYIGIESPTRRCGDRKSVV